MILDDAAHMPASANLALSWVCDRVKWPVLVQITGQSSFMIRFWPMANRYFYPCLMDLPPWTVKTCIACVQPAIPKLDHQGEGGGGLCTLAHPGIAALLRMTIDFGLASACRLWFQFSSCVSLQQLTGWSCGYHQNHIGLCGWREQVLFTLHFLANIPSYCNHQDNCDSIKLTSSCIPA